MVKSDDEKRARLEEMRFVLRRTDHEGADAEVVGVPDPRIVGRASEVDELGERVAGAA